MNELDRHQLDETIDWELERYQSSVRGTVNTLVDAIQNGVKYALEREIRYDDDMRSEYSYIDQAAEIQHAIIQAVNNADFRGLTNTAGDLHATTVARRSLNKLKETLPAEITALLAEREDAALRGRIDDIIERRKELETKDANGCRASVSQGRMGVGRCGNKGNHTLTVDGRPGYLGELTTAKDPNAIEIKVCGTHAKDASRGRIHVFVAREWDASQNALYRKREDRKLQRMNERLSGVLDAAPETIQITDGSES